MRSALSKTNRTVCSFRRWSRSKFGILRSLRSVVKICTLCIAYNIVKCPLPAAAQTDSTVIAPLREVDEVEVVGKKSMLLPGTGVMIVSIPVTGLERFPSSGLQDILEYAGNIDIRQRGRNGVQSDVSIRGGSFDHVLVLLNGISMNDPQTGHGSMDIPVDKDIVERIEVSYGPSSMIYGPGAFTGAVNIITAKGESSGIMAGQEAGMYGLLKSRLNIIHAGKSVSSILSFNRQSSTGYAADTDFRTYNFYVNSGYSSSQFNILLQGGHQNKKFGASGFYTPLFPHQYENTAMSFAGLRLETGRQAKFSAQLYWRQKFDEFMLDRNNPSFYRNFHRTNVYGGQAGAKRSFGWLTIESAFVFRSENIISNSLGYPADNHVRIKGTDSLWYDKSFGRNSGSLSARIIYQKNKSEITAGINLLAGSGYHQNITILPSLGFEYALVPGLRLFADLNAGSAMPSFTDLFYKDPNNEGFSGLVNASNISAGTGVKFSYGNITGSSAVFASNGNNITEWLWSDDINRYKPFNTDNYFTSGFEGTAEFRFRTKKKYEHTVIANYMYLYVQKNEESLAKYNNLKHKLSVMLSGSLPYNFRTSFNISFQDRQGSYITYSEQQGYTKVPYKPVWLADMNIEWQYRFVLLFAGATNILNTSYSDAGSLNQPGRWLSGGITITLH